MARKYLNNYTTLLSAAITDTDTTMTVGTAPAALNPGDYYRLQLSLRNAQGVLTKQEFVDVTAVSGNDLTITRAAEGSTALSWDIGARVELVETAASFDLAGGATSLGSLDDVTLTTVSDGEVLAYNATSMQWENTAVGGTGTVTSVGMTAPTGLTVSGSPITTSGTLALAFDTGYSIPTNAKQLQWDDAYSWGDHALAGYQSQLVSGTNIKTVNGNSLLGSGDLVVAGSAGALNDLTDVTITTPASGEVLAYDGAGWVNQAVGGTGTVTSVAMTVPTGLSVSGSPITSSGTLAIALESGYSIPTDAQQNAWLERSGDTITDTTITEYTETINAAAGATLDRSTGGIQRLNMGANTTLNLSDLTAGQSVMYRVTGGTTYTLSYTGLGAWSNGTTPTLSATHYLEFVHDGVEVVGFDCGGR